jgi:rhodanese-related sulfurtransferase
MGNDLEDTAVPRITVEELRELLLKDSENVVLVDLRDEDYGEPKIEGAIKNKGKTKNLLLISGPYPFFLCSTTV